MSEMRGRKKESGKSAVSVAEKTALYGLLIALAFVLSFVETLIPVTLMVPGMKLGLANLVTIVGLYTVGIGGTVIVSVVRIVLVGFTFGNTFSMMYSLGGWLLSIAIMTVCKKRDWFSSIGISILGGVGHNIGQLTVAAFVVKQAGVFIYLPALLAAGTVAGLVIGLVGGLIVERLPRFIKKI